jgi:hypothetical protein
VYVRQLLTVIGTNTLAPFLAPLFLTSGDGPQQGGGYQLWLQQVQGMQQLQQLYGQHTQLVQQAEQLMQQMLLLQENQLVEAHQLAQQAQQRNQQMVQLIQQAQQHSQRMVQLTQQVQQVQQRLQRLNQVAPAASVHTAAAALVPALQRLPKLRSCWILGLPVAESVLQLLPPSLLSLQVSQRAFHAPVSLAAASRLVALDLPDLQPSDTLSPSLRKLVLHGQQQMKFKTQPLEPLTQLETLEMLGCAAETMEWQEDARNPIPAIRVDVSSSSELFPSVLWRPDLAVDLFAKHRCV